MKYKITSDDSHVDMNWLPRELFVENNSKPHLQDFMLRIVETPKGLDGLRRRTTFWM